MNNPLRPSAEHHALETRFAATVSAGLALGAERLPVDVATRLRFARERAVRLAGQQRRAAVAIAAGRAAPASVAVAAGGFPGSVGLGDGFVPLWQRLASVVPLLTLLAGLVVIDHWTVREQVLAAADFDTQLLSDDLPPSAYSDPGFAEYLKSSAP